MKTFIEQLAEIVSANGQKAALVFESQTLTYAELDILSSRIAAKALSLGIQKESVIPIILPRGIFYIAAELGILKAGGAFSPLSLEYPKERVSFIQQDCASPFSIDEAFIAEALECDPLERPLETSWQDAAMVIYTSGSTGNPKGITHDHYSFAHAILSQLPIGCPPDGIELSVSPFNFAITALDIFVPLWVGATIHILSEQDRKDIPTIEAYIDAHGITSSVMNAQLLKHLPDRPSTLVNICCGGERISGIYRKNGVIHNGYGLSETLSVVLSFTLDKAYDNTPVGTPLEGFSVFLLDEKGNTVHEGEEGEICIAGPLARGYLNLPEKTAQTFVHNPFAQGEDDSRLLKTGDMGRLLPDGSILYVNRKDWMVKVNGQRVEMGEIEIQMNKIPDVDTAVVKSFEDSDGQTFLCGYFKGTASLTEQKVRATLSTKFPSYMIPRFLVKLDEFPLNVNGKLDRKVLAAPESSHFKKQYAAPETPEQELVCRGFESVLGIEQVGINDDFFEMGGDSLKVVILQDVLKELHLSSSSIFEGKTPGGIASRVGEGAEHATRYLNMDVERDAYPLTDSQLGIYLACLQDPHSLMYNNPARFIFTADLQIVPEKLQAALLRTISAFPFMKIHMETHDGFPVIVPNPGLAYSIPIINAEEKSDGDIARDFIKPFDLTTGPLFRFALYQRKDEVVLMGDLHHVIADGASTALFYQSVMDVYEGRQPVAEQISSFTLCNYEESLKNTSEYAESRKFFDAMLAGVEVDSNLLTDEISSEPPEPEKCRVLHFSLKDSLDCAALERRSKALGLTESTLFLSAFTYALAKMTGQNETLFCTLDNGRHVPELKHTLGMLVRTLPLYTRIDEEQSVADFMATMQEKLFSCMRHDACSFVDLASEYGVTSEMLFVYQGSTLSGISFNDKQIPMEMVKLGDSMANFSVDILKKKDDYELLLEYRTNLYQAKTIESFGRLMIRIIRGFLNDGVLKDISLCEKQDWELLRSFNDNTVPFDRSLTMVELLREQFAATPDRIAVVYEDRSLTYRQLDELSERLAIALTRMHVGLEKSVGIMVKRSERFPLCTVGVIKAGGVCLPLDINYPAERLSYMLEDSDTQIIVMDRELACILPDYQGSIIYTDELEALPLYQDTPFEVPQQENLFALLYTSGTTGKPKGCMLTHGNLVNFCLSFQDYFDITCEDRASAYGSFSFDASMQDIYPYLTKGASVHIVPEETRLDLVALHEFLLAHNITMCDCTTQLGRQYATQYPDNPSLKALTVGGEKLVPCKPPRYPLVNTYGPTEATIYVTNFLIERDYSSVPIGKSFGNCDIYIVDSHLRLLPIGAPGELCVAGLPVTRGYLNRPELTKEKYPANPFSDEAGYERMYLTGDVCRYLPDGNIQYVGRQDEQVKIRGFRIELTEIERRIRAFSDITDACVIATELPAGGKAIIAYIVASSNIDTAALDDFITSELPSYMVPAITMQIDSIPVNPNGKVDKRRLPEPQAKAAKQQTSVRPLNLLEKEIAALVTELTGQEVQEVCDDLVSIGLSSLSTIILTTRLYERYGCRLKVSDLLDGGTILTIENAILKEMLERATKEEGFFPQNDFGMHLNRDEGNESRKQPLSMPLSSAQLGVYYDSAKRPNALLYNIPMLYHCGFGLDAEKLVTAVEQVLTAYPILSARIHTSNGNLEQTISPNVKPSVPLLEMNSHEFDEYKRNFAQPFDLARGPLYRAAVVRVAQQANATEQEIILLFDVHHIVFDGLSLTNFLEAVKHAYEEGIVEPEKHSFFEAIQEEQLSEQGEAATEALAYYDALFSGFENASTLPTDLPGRQEEGKLGECVALVSAEALESFCHAQGVTPAQLFLAAAFYTVARFTNDRQVYLSMISSGREDIRFHSSIGMFVKTLPLKTDIVPGQSVLDFVKMSGKALRQAVKHSSYPFIKLLDRYGYSPQINYACQLGVDSPLSIAGDLIGEEVLTMPLPKFNISLHIETREGSPAVCVQYNDALYSKSFAQRLANAMVACVSHMLAAPGEDLTKVSLLSPDDWKQVSLFGKGISTSSSERELVEMSEEEPMAVPEESREAAPEESLKETSEEKTRAVGRVAVIAAETAETRAEGADYREEQLFHRCFERQAARYPERTALVAMDDSLTFQALDKQMNRLANSLLERGIQPQDRVLIMLPRTSHLIIAQYGVMKAGAVYIPCDPDYPVERIRHIAEDSNASLILTTKENSSLLEDARAVAIEHLLTNTDEEAPSVHTRAEDLAYIIYTSGSTGLPKGVMITHGSISNYLACHPANRHVYAIANEGHVLVSVTTVSFDMSLKETAVALCNGLTLVLASEEEAHNPHELVQLFERTAGDVFNTTPSRMSHYLQLDSFCKVLSRCSVVMCGGEKFSPKLLAQLQETTKARIFNTYGPTEITVSCNAKELTEETEVTIGAPLLNVQEYIVDRDGNELPIGVVGELYVGGMGVARGYWNQPERTDEQFVCHRGNRVYKTGDYAQWTEEGDVVILGRTDNQVKLRGLRIELGEVEKCILSQKQIKEAEVQIREIDGREHLCAWLTAENPLDLVSLKASLARSLAIYMVPTAYCQLEALPTNPNGKVDSRALPLPELMRTESSAEAPMNDTEKIFCSIFANILGMERVGATDNFFELGGTSLTVTSVLIQANEQGFPISYGDVFTQPTPRGLSNLLTAILTKTAETPAAEDSYDYQAINELLEQNNLDAFAKGTTRAIGNLLLTGATGFLGIHLLQSYLRTEQGTVYCLLRSQGDRSAEDRLKSQLFYYFEDDYAELFGERIRIVEGDVTTTDWINILMEEPVETIINCAALVKHFASGSEIEDVNVGGVANLINFCESKGGDIRLIQISTGSVAGDRVNGVPDTECVLTEQRLYFGQNLDNKYVFSKFTAERLILEATTRGLDAKIMRVGNLAARETDGEFQINFTTNGFAGRLRAYCIIGAFPFSSMNTMVEMAPIDSTAETIMKLVTTPQTCCVFHPYNNHYVPLGDIILQMRRMGMKIQLAEDEEFQKALENARHDQERAQALTTLLAYDTMDTSKSIEPIAIDNEYTTQVLYRLGFEWPMTSRDYMNQFLKALDGLGFFTHE